MSDKSDQINSELLNIKIAIELDQGTSIDVIAEKFGVKRVLVQNVAKKSYGLDIQAKKTKSRHYSETEKAVLVGRIESGDSLEDLALETGITENTLRRWCKLSGVVVPRNLEQISLAEQREIREFLEEQDPQEVARTYNISLDSLEELKEPAHSLLDAETLSYLFELLREKPRASSKTLCRDAKEVGLEIPEGAVNSFRKRLKSKGII